MAPSLYGFVCVYFVCIEFLLNAHLNIFIPNGYQGDDILFSCITEIIFAIMFSIITAKHIQRCVNTW